MRRRLLIISIVAFLAVLAFLVSGCSHLSSKESTIDKRFSALVPELNRRYDNLEEALTIAEQVGGKREVVTEGKKSLTEFKEATEKKNVNKQLDSARELENIIGRLNANAKSSPKLVNSPELANALALIDETLPAQDVRDSYNQAIESYEEQRTSWRYLASSVFGGYSAPKKIEFWTPIEESN